MTLPRIRSVAGRWRYDFWLNTERSSNPYLDENGLPVTARPRRLRLGSASGIHVGSDTLAWTAQAGEVAIDRR